MMERGVDDNRHARDDHAEASSRPIILASRPSEIYFGPRKAAQDDDFARHEIIYFQGFGDSAC